MANKNTITVTLTVDDKGSVIVKQFGQNTDAAMKQAGTATDDLGSKTTGLATSAKSSFETIKGQWLAVTAAAAAAVGVAKKCISAYMEEEAAQMKLAVAMKNQGDFTRESYSALIDYAAQIQKTTAYADDEAIATMANLKTYGMNTEELKRATQASLDLATAKGMDLMTASELVGKAFVGETGTLSRYGIVVDEGVGKTEKFDAVLGQIQNRFGGAAAAEIETYSGQWKQIANWWGDQMEKAGLVLLKTLEALQVAVGAVGIGFYTVLENLAGGLRTLAEQGAKLPIVGEAFAGLADHLKTVEGGYKAAKEGALEFTDKNVKMLTTFDRVETAAEKMGNGIKKVAKSAGEVSVAEAKKAAEEAKKHAEAFAEAQKKIAEAASETNQKIRTETEATYAAIYSKAATPYEKGKAAIESQAAAWLKAGADAVAVGEWKTAKIIELEKRQEEEVKKRSAAAGDAAAEAYKAEVENAEKLLAKKEADSKTYQTMMAAEADFADTENERAINAIIAAHEKKINELNKIQEGGNLKYQEYVAAKELIDKNYNAALVEQSRISREKVLSAELAGFETSNEYAKQAYEIRIEQIEMQAEKMLEMGASYDSVLAYIQDKTKEAYQNMALAGDDWVEGFKVGLDQAAESMGTWASNAAQTAKDFATASKTAISTTLFDFIKTGTADLKTIGTSFCDSMLQSFTDTVGKMATKFTMDFMEKIIASAMSQPITVTFTALWDAASAVVLAGIKALQSFFSYEGGYVRESGIGAYADGGMIPGYATGGDSKANDKVLSWLSPGEYVEPRSAVNAETIPELEHIRKYKRPRYYAEGGLIDPLQTYSDDYQSLAEPYKSVYTAAGLSYYNGQWGLLSGYDQDKDGKWGFKNFAPVSDPVTYAGKWLNETNHYNLQDENDPPQALDQADYKYLLDWYVSANQLMNVGGGEGWDPGSIGIRTSPVTGSVDPNVIWTEQEGSGYRFYFRDGSEEFRDASESNWLKRYMPTIIKAVGAVAALAIATAAALPTGGTSYGILSGITAAIEGGMASGAALAGAAGTGLYSAFVSYGETGSITGSIIAGIIAAAATALSFGSPWAESETGLMVLKSEMNPSGYLTSAQGRIIADVIRKGGGAVLQDTINSVAGGGGSMALSKAGEPGGLGEMESLYNALPGMMSGSFSLARGLDYVPYDNFPARLHEGEAVLTKEANKRGRGNIIMNFNLNGTVIDRQAVNAFAKEIYPKLKKLEERNY